MKRHGSVARVVLMTALLSAMVLIVSLRATSAGEPILIRFGGGAAPSHPISQGQIAFKKQAEELSGGRIKVEVYHANQLGGMVQMMEMVKTGTLTMSHAGIPFCSRLAPKMELLSLPFLLTKRERALALVDGPVGTEMGEEMDKAGIRIIGWFELGFRHLTNSKREVQSPTDMNLEQISHNAEPPRI